MKSRVPAGTYLPLALLLCTASWATGWPPSLSAWVINFALACTLLIQFRLWDDLNDLERDRLDYPQRVLSKTASLTPFRLALAALFALNFALLAFTRPWPILSIFLILNAGFFVWYRASAFFRINNAFGYHVVLLKYPTFVFLIAPVGDGTLTPAATCAMGMIYFCFCVYEVLHDLRLHPIRGTFHLLAIEMVALQLAGLLMVVELRTILEPLAAIQLGLSLIGALVLAFLFHRHQSQAPPGRWCYAVFFLGFVLLLNFSFATYHNIGIG